MCSLGDKGEGDQIVVSDNEPATIKTTLASVLSSPAARQVHWGWTQTASYGVVAFYQGQSEKALAYKEKSALSYAPCFSNDSSDH